MTEGGFVCRSTIVSNSCQTVMEVLTFILLMYAHTGVLSKGWILFN